MPTNRRRAIPRRNENHVVERILIGGHWAQYWDFSRGVLKDHRGIIRRNRGEPPPAALDVILRTAWQELGAELLASHPDCWAAQRYGRPDSAN